MVGLAGNGKRRDGVKASMECREFLTNVLSSRLARHATERLDDEMFPKQVQLE
jgi:hypothetical protein